MASNPQIQTTSLWCDGGDSQPFPIILAHGYWSQQGNLGYLALWLFLAVDFPWPEKFLNQFVEQALVKVVRELHGAMLTGTLTPGGWGASLRQSLQGDGGTMTSQTEQSWFGCFMLCWLVLYCGIILLQEFMNEGLCYISYISIIQQFGYILIYDHPFYTMVFKQQ